MFVVAPQGEPTSRLVFGFVSRGGGVVFDRCGEPLEDFGFTDFRATFLAERLVGEGENGFEQLDCSPFLAVNTVIIRLPARNLLGSSIA